MFEADRDGGVTLDSARRRALRLVHASMGLSCAAVLDRVPDGWLLLALEGEPPRAWPEGTRVSDLGAAAPAASGNRPVLLNPDRPRPLRVPYAALPRVLAGGGAVPIPDGLVWFDREDRPVTLDDVEAVVQAFAMAEDAGRSADRLRGAQEQVRRLSDTIEGIRTILESAGERESVAALGEVAGRHVGARTGLVLLAGPQAGTATVVAGTGAGARDLVGHVTDVTGLVDLAMRTGQLVPAGARYQPVMGPLPGLGASLRLSAGEPILVSPLGTVAEPLGVLILVGGDLDDPGSLHGVRTLCESAALLLQQVRLRERVRIDAMVDGLTGLYNRRAFLELLNQASAFCGRHGNELSLLMVDADHFKAVNDRHGHPAGDAVLRYIADNVRRGLRGSDFAGRYGGEEFVVALPHTGIDGARVVAERIRTLCAASPVPVGTARIPVTVSLGAACLRPGSAGPDELIRVADAALYEAKRTGRNRVVAR